MEGRFLLQRIMELAFFLNLLKSELGFEDADDFKSKIRLDFNLRFKIQKFVFLAKYFGWNNSYVYNLHRNGPYAPALTEDYYSKDIFKWGFSEIDNFRYNSFKEFIMNKSNDYLEAASTILLYKEFNQNLSLNDAAVKLSQIKPHISSQTVNEAFWDVEGLTLTKKQNQIQTPALKDFKNALNNKIINDIRLFENFEINYNRVFVLGSLDYLRIVLREENLNTYLKKELFNLISKYIDDVDNIYLICDGNGEIFENMNLSPLEDFFDRLQNYISQELDILPRLDGDDFDESLFYF